MVSLPVSPLVNPNCKLTQTSFDIQIQTYNVIYQTLICEESDARLRLHHDLKENCRIVFLANQTVAGSVSTLCNLPNYKLTNV